MTTQSQIRQSAQPQSGSLLRFFLRANATFSMITALLMILASGSVAEFMGLDDGLPFLVIGVSLIGWAFIVFKTSQSDEVNRALVNSIIGGDAMWVIGSALLLVFDPFNFSAEGKWAVLIVADIVFTFGAGQWWGLRKLNR